MGKRGEMDGTGLGKKRIAADAPPELEGWGKAGIPCQEKSAREEGKYRGRMQIGGMEEEEEEAFSVQY